MTVAQLELKTPAETARILRISTRTLREYAAEGRIGSVMFSQRCRRYPVSEIQNFIDKKFKPVKNFCE